MENTLSNPQEDPLQPDPKKTTTAATKPLLNKVIHNLKTTGIQTKVTILALLFSVIPVIAVGTITYKISGESLAKQVEQEKLKEVEDIIGRLDSYLAEQESVVANIGRVVSNVLQEQGEKEAQRVLTAYAKEYYYYHNMALYDTKGNELVRPLGDEEPISPGGSVYFEQAVALAVPIISEPVETLLQGEDEYSVFIAAPVKIRTVAAGGNVNHILVARIPVEVMGRAVLPKEKAQEVTTYKLVDGSGKIFEDFDESTNASLKTEIGQSFNQFSTLNNERENSVVIAGDYIYAYGAFSYSNQRQRGFMDWSLVTATDVNVAFADQRRLAQAILAGTVVTAALAALLATLIASRSLKPLLKATAAVQKLGQGDLKTRLEVIGTDELSQLGSNINQMAEQLDRLLERQRINTEKLIYQNSVLNDLAQYEGLVQGNVKSSANRFTQATSSTLTVQRTSIWLLNTTRDELICIDLYDDKTKQHSEGISLKAEDYPVYFQTLEEFVPIVVDEITRDKNNPKKEFRDSYLLPMGISSTLDIPIRTADRIVGVVICEHIGESRAWEATEISFGISVGNLVALALESQLIQEEVGELLESVSAVEEGDLTIRAHVSERTTGLVADTLNRLLEQLAQILLQVRSVAGKVSERSTQLEQLANEVADNATNQAEEAGGVLQLTQKVAQSAQESTQKVEEANHSLIEVRSYVERGQKSMEEMNQSISVLQNGTERMVQQTKTLAEFVGLADQFVQDQTHIASLTQILALNATLVATRASVQKDPRKFGEVAREFQTIAQQVSSLAQQTNDGLVNLQQRTDQINNVVLTINAEVQSLANLVDGFNQGVQQSDQVFRQIRNATQGVVAVGQTVAQSSQSILTAAKTTAEGMYDIAELAQATAELTKQSLIQSEQMESLSTNLLSRISFFRLPDHRTIQS